MRKIDRLRKKYVGRFRRTKSRIDPNTIKVYRVMDVEYDPSYKDYFLKCVIFLIKGNYEYPICSFFVSRETHRLPLFHMGRTERCTKAWLQTMHEEYLDIMKEFLEVPH